MHLSPKYRTLMPLWTLWIGWNGWLLVPGRNGQHISLLSQFFCPSSKIAQAGYAQRHVRRGQKRVSVRYFLENHWLIRCILCLSYMLFSLLTYALFVNNIGVSFSHRQESFTLVAFVKLV